VRLRIMVPAIGSSLRGKARKWTMLEKHNTEWRVMLSGAGILVGLLGGILSLLAGATRPTPADKLCFRAFSIHVNARESIYHCRSSSAQSLD